MPPATLPAPAAAPAAPAPAPPPPASHAPLAFRVAALGLALAELARVWLVMPLPGSQRLPSLALAYAAHQARWPLRLALGALLLAGLPAAWRAARRRRLRWTATLPLALAAGAAWMANVGMAADRMFLEPRTLVLRPAAANRVAPDRLVVGVVVGGVPRAYPLRFIGYHHQVRDTVGGRPVLVTYCTVCRTGRVFDPTVAGRVERFRLVGMDRWNAMFEDATTGSWWRQATGEAVAGPRRGAALAELPSQQVTLGEWLRLYPASLVMQADPAAEARYGSDARTRAYETGESRAALTGSDPASWREKSWVVGLTVGGASRAYDWNRLARERVVNDTLGGAPVAVVLAGDRASFVAFRRPDAATRLALRGDSLVASGAAGATPARGRPAPAWALDGRGPAGALERLQASQEFWHSWRTFHPGTGRY